MGLRWGIGGMGCWGDGLPQYSNTPIPNRITLNADVLFLWNRLKWDQLPRSMGAITTVRNRFLEWRKAGVFQRMWKAGLLTYDELRASFWYGRKRNDTNTRGDRPAILTL